MLQLLDVTLFNPRLERSFCVNIDLRLKIFSFREFRSPIDVLLFQLNIGMYNICNNLIPRNGIVVDFNLMT